MVQIQWDVVLFFVVGVLLLYGVGWLLLVPLRKVLGFVFNSLVGGALLLIVSAVGQSWGIVAVVNPFAAIMTGLLGIPGVILVLLIQNLL